MKQKYIDYYMDVAHRTAQLSEATRLKVGAVLVRDNDIISVGFNGTPIGYVTNECEYVNEFGELVTKEITIHGEMNAIIHANRKGITVQDAVMFITHTPCWNCSKHMVQSGIKEIYYRTKYRMFDDDQMKFFDDMKVKLIQV